MDPWGENKANTEIALSFEDNFKPLISDTLPDSAEYLQSLERKLAALKNDPDFLKQLREKREACLQNLLNGEVQFDDGTLNEPINSSEIPMTTAMTSIDTSKKTIVIVTGASKGIGRTISLEISRNLNQNSIMVLIARNEQELKQTMNLIQEVDKNLTVIPKVIDLAKTNDIKTFENLFDDVIKSINVQGIQFGIIFHNAGSTGDVKQTTDLYNYDSWKEHYDLNLFSTAILNSAFVKKIRPIAPQLGVVNITSKCGRVPFKNLAMYGSSKAARELFFKVFAVEEPNVIVLNYSPGPVQTDMFDSIIDSAQSDEVREGFKQVKDSSILSTEQTVGKLLLLLEKGAFKSGDTIDFYDEIV